MAALISIVFLVVMAPVVTGVVEFGPPVCAAVTENNILMLRSLFTFTTTPGQQIGSVVGYREVNGVFIRVAGCNFTITPVSGIGNYHQIDTKIDLSNDSNTINGCGITKTTYNGSEAYRMLVGLREDPDFVKVNDSTYSWYCVKDEAPSTFLTTSVIVETPNMEQTVNPLYINATLEVLKRNSSNIYAVTGSCNVGDDLRLRVTYHRPLPHGLLTPWGALTYNTKFGPDLASVAETITLNNGCITSNRLEFSAPFVRTTSSSEGLGVYEATGGKCKRFGKSKTIVFFTTVDFCSGQYLSDQRCINYCSWSLAQSGRKKRSDDNNSENLIVKVTINDEKSETESFKPLLIGLVVGVFALLVIVVAIAVYVLCINRRQRRSSSKSRFSNSSSNASSVRSEPSKY